MLKSQWMLLLLGLAVTFGLYQLPTGVVNDADELPSQANAPTPPSSPPPPTSIPSSELEKKLSTLKNSFKNSNNKAEKIIFADSIAMRYKAANQWDSVSVYADFIAQESQDSKYLQKTGDLYYDAFNFYAPITQEKSREYALKAREVYQKLLEKNPSDLDSKAKLATTYVSGENPMEGIQLLLKILQEDEGHPIALKNLGLFSMQTGQYDKAIARFEKLVSVAPEDSQAKLFLAQSYANAGRKDQAIPLLQEIEQTETDSLLRAAAIDYIQQLK